MRIWLLLAALCFLAAPSRSQPADEARLQTVVYNSAQAGALPLYAWPGRRVVLLTPNGQLDELAVRRLVEAMDKAWEFLADSTGREPVRDARTAWKGLAIVAVVPSTCGDMCGIPEHAGIEINNQKWEQVYSGVRDRNVFDTDLFYQVGMCFWFYHEQTIGADAIAVGFGIWARFAGMEAAGVDGTSFRGNSFEEFRRTIKSLAKIYEADPRFGFKNTILEDKGVPNAMGLGAADLFASFVMNLLASGDKEFGRNFWREMARRPRSRTPEESADNLFLAASAAWGGSQIDKFEAWRWPISEGARAEAEAMITREALGGDGLSGQYFRGDSAQPEKTRIDKQLNFEWSDGPAFEGGPADGFSVRWSGFLMAHEAGAYTLYLNVDDGARLWIDGNLIIDQWQDHIGEDTVEVKLPARRKVPIKIEYREATGAARLKLLWSSERLHRQVVPQDNLFSE